MTSAPHIRSACTHTASCAAEAEAHPMGPGPAARVPASRKPPWIRALTPGGENFKDLRELLRGRSLHTVCEEAQCPNRGACWASGTATLMIGSDTCTRACRFCAVKTARQPPPLNPHEPEEVASSVEAMKLKYVVLTSVDRDDLSDGGADHFAQTIQAIKKRTPHVLVEALVPDFRGDRAAIAHVVEAGVDVYAHNVETVARLQKRVRDARAGYRQSLDTLRDAKAHARHRGGALYTKSSLMLGLGERPDEVEQAFTDLRAVEVDVVTLGQYLRPTLQHLPVEAYVTPDQFDAYARLARAKGFRYCASGPMVRSSYKAAELFVQAQATDAP